MVALIAIMLCLIGIYAKKNKQLQQYVHRTERVSNYMMTVANIKVLAVPTKP